MKTKTKINITSHLINKLKKHRTKFIPPSSHPHTSLPSSVPPSKSLPFPKPSSSLSTKPLSSIIKSHLLKHNSTETTHHSNIITWIMFDEKHRIVSIFKNYLLWDESSEFLRRYYYLNESLKRLPKISYYYEQYTLFPANYYGLSYSEVKIMTKWIKRKIKYYEHIENDIDVSNNDSDNLISINIHKSKNENNEYIYNNNNLLISPNEIESSNKSKSKSFNEHISSMFKEMNKPSHTNKSLCSLMKDISSIHSYKKHKQHLQIQQMQKGKIDLKSTSTNKSKKTIHIIQGCSFTKSKVLLMKKKEMLTKGNNVNVGYIHKVKNTKSTMTSQEKHKQKKRLPIVTEPLLCSSVNLQKTNNNKKRLVLKQPLIKKENMFIKNIRNCIEKSCNSKRANSVKSENKKKVIIGRNKNKNVKYSKTKINTNYKDINFDDVRYSCLLTERSQQSRGISGSSNDITRNGTKRKVVSKKKTFHQIIPKTQRINNEQEMIKKLLLRKKHVI